MVFAFSVQSICRSNRFSLWAFQTPNLPVCIWFSAMTIDPTPIPISKKFDNFLSV